MEQKDAKTTSGDLAPLVKWVIGPRKGTHMVEGAPGRESRHLRSSSDIYHR